MFKVNNRNTRKRCERCPNVIGVVQFFFIINFEHSLNLFLVFLLLSLTKETFAGFWQKTWFRNNSQHTFNQETNLLLACDIFSFMFSEKIEILLELDECTFMQNVFMPHKHIDGVRTFISFVYFYIFNYIF